VTVALTAFRGRRYGLAHPEDEPPEVGRVQAVGVLVRVDEFEEAVGRHPVREGELHDETRAGRVGVQPGDDGLDVGLGRARGEVFPDRGDAHLCAVGMLAVDVPHGAGVVPDEQGPEAGHDAPLGEVGDPRPQLILDGLRHRLAVQNLCGHVAPYC
jgi:hypothetical protein